MKRKGVTLVELLVVLAIGTILTLGVYNMQNAQFNIYKQQSNELELQTDSKIAVERIANDIKKSRFTQYSVELNFTSDKFTRLNLGSQYTPIVYVDEIEQNGSNASNSCIYAIKQLASERQLVRIQLTSNEFTLGTGQIIDDYNQANYSNINSFTGAKMSSVLSDLRDTNGTPVTWAPTDTNISMYEQNENYYLIDNTGGNHYQYDLIQQSSNLTRVANGETVIADNISNVSVTATSGSNTVPYPKNNAFNIYVELSKIINLNGTPVNYTKSFSTCATRVRYGDGDD